MIPHSAMYHRFAPTRSHRHRQPDFLFLSPLPNLGLYLWFRCDIHQFFLSFFLSGSDKCRYLDRSHHKTQYKYSCKNLMKSLIYFPFHFFSFFPFPFSLLKQRLKSPKNNARNPMRYLPNHRKCQKAHSGIASSRQALRQARTLAHLLYKKSSVSNSRVELNFQPICRLTGWSSTAAAVC